MNILKKRKEASEKTARQIDRDRELAENQQENKVKAEKQKRKIARTVLQTIPYEYHVSNYVMLLKSNVRVGRQTVNLYSKSYLVPDVNYSTLPRDQQEAIQEIYAALLNGFDNTASIQITLMNTPINKLEFEERMLMKEQHDGLNEERQELNTLLHKRIMEGQHGLQCRIYMSVTVAAINLEAANTRFFTLEAHLINTLGRLGTEPIPLTANDRVRLLANIFRDVNQEFRPATRREFARQAEKQLCCPDYFEFKKDYFIFNDKFARCLYFKRMNTGMDVLFKELIETNLNIIITKNVEFVDQNEALTLLKRKLTDMKQEEISRTRKAADQSRGAFVDPIEGTQLAVDKEEAQDFLNKLQARNQKMTLCQFLIVITADSYNELKAATDKIQIILRKRQIESINAPYRQEQALASALPIGNSISFDKEHNIQVRRTLSSEGTAVFMPFNARELMHEGGLYYGQNKLSHSVIMFDRSRLNNPNGFIFGVPGSGKSVTAKLEMIYSILSTTGEILILDPEREYTAIAELLGGEVIYISENSKTHINPLDLTENPDKTDTEYDPIKAKLDFMLSFFSCILGNQEISPIQKTIIDNVMIETYKKHQHPTLREYYDELECYEQTVADETKSAVTYLRQTLHLYVHGSMNVFANPSNVNINKRIVVYDIKDLGKNLQTLGMMIVLENLWDRVAHNRARGVHTRIYIDEMYLLFKSEQSANFFYELYKRARKWGGIPTGITQNVEDLLRSDLARTMLSNTQFVVMLSQNATDRDQLAQLLQIPPETMMYVTNSGVGNGLIYAGEYGTIPFDNKFPTDTKIYRIISTKFGEQLAQES